MSNLDLAQYKMLANNLKGQYNWGIDLSHFSQNNYDTNFYLIIILEDKKG
jgi:hypothetical protein